MQKRATGTEGFPADVRNDIRDDDKEADRRKLKEKDADITVEVLLWTYS